MVISNVMQMDGKAPIGIAKKSELLISSFVAISIKLPRMPSAFAVSQCCA